MTPLNPGQSTLAPLAPPAWAPLWPGHAPTPPHRYGIGPNDADFVALQAALRPSGGRGPGADLAACLGQGDDGGHARLARLIVSGQAFSFAWHDSYWLPMFQFHPLDLRLRSESRAVLGELSEVLDGWSLAVWFAQPCCCLAGRSPAALMQADLPAVLQAARLHRFVVVG